MFFEAFFRTKEVRGVRKSDISARTPNTKRPRKIAIIGETFYADLFAGFFRFLFFLFNRRHRTTSGTGAPVGLGECCATGVRKYNACSSSSSSSASSPGRNFSSAKSGKPARVVDGDGPPGVPRPVPADSTAGRQRTRYARLSLPLGGRPLYYLFHAILSLSARYRVTRRARPIYCLARKQKKNPKKTMKKTTKINGRHFDRCDFAVFALLRAP